MNVRDPKFTARLEEALRVLAKQPTRPLAYLSSRFGLESGDLAMWLGEFNGGKKVLQPARIDQVKAELGALTVQRATPAAKHSAPNTPASAAAPAGPPPTLTPISAPTADIGRWLEQQRAKITARVNCFQVEVTPAMATAWLAFNTGNRVPSKQKIRRFAAAMVAGRWALNGETVKFSVSGRLIDGQSRLLAIQIARVPIVLEIRAGLPDVAQESMDAGELRKGAHVLQMLGEGNPAIVAAALKILWIWRKGWLGGYPFGVSRVMENSEVAPLIEEHAGLKASAGWTVSAGSRVDRLMPRSEAAFFHYMLGRANAKMRDSFFEALVEGVGLTKRSPTYHLRERLMANRGGPDPEAKKQERRAIVIKAFNAYQMGANIDRLGFSDSEDFPAIDGIPAPAPEKRQERAA